MPRADDYSLKRDRHPNLTYYPDSEDNVHSQLFEAMRSQLSPHTFVALLGHCFRSPICQHAQSYSQAAYPSSKSLHSLSQAYRRRLPDNIKRHRRQFQTGHDPHAERGVFLLPTAPVQVASPQTHTGHQTLVGGNRPGPKRPPRVAILGGGISGLTAAYFLLKVLPNVKVTLYEASDRLGGWIQSDQVNVGNGDVILEAGPRSLLAPTPAKGWVTAKLVC